MRSGGHLEREHVKDLRVLRAGAAHHIDGFGVVIVCPVGLDVFQEHGFHGAES
jgi:hypothetical protein